MTCVTFQVLEGVDKGRVFPNLPIPVTIGREEGNILRLNDERVSRFHAKIQQDSGDVILTDLDSTNGTRINGNVVQIRRLRPGDRVCVGRSLLLFGSNAEIAARMESLQVPGRAAVGNTANSNPNTQSHATIQARPMPGDVDEDMDVALSASAEVTVSTGGTIFIGQMELPPLPQRLTPAQAARVAEIIDFLHRGLTRATDSIKANEEGTQVVLTFADWQKVIAVQMLLARYLRGIADPESLAR